MKNFFFTLVVFFSCIVSAFAFSGGTGTANNPYLIANFSDWHDMINQSTSSAHYRLISDINIEPYIIGENTAQWSFSGFLYGSGHALLLPDSINTNILDVNTNVFYLLPKVFGSIDSVRITGNTTYMFTLSESVENGGEISNCTNEANALISGEYYAILYGFFSMNIFYGGRILNCINYGNLTVQNVDPWVRIYAGAIVSYNYKGEINGCRNYGNIMGCFAAGGICAVNNGTIRNCTNYGDIISPQDVMLDDDVTEFPSGGIYAITDFAEEDCLNIIEKCMNYGRINAGKLYSGGGIVGGGSVAPGVQTNVVENITNCANYGEVIGGKYLGGIYGKLNAFTNISSCFNAGQVASATSSGGIVGTVYDTAHISNCLDVSGMHIMIDHWEVTGDSISNMSSNYYDRQMSGGSGEDIEGETEGRLTSQLTGDTPELRAMLGDGWSYAEGRYPIPLGLENDSLAMLFATPIYLRVINDDNYDHTNLVRNNFTVGTENGVSWSSGDRLSIDGENATILASGSETATASLAGYSFSRSLRLDPITGELVATDCDSYLWNGDEYTASGDYIQVLTASNGCDSIVTLHLTINNSVHYSFTETATSPYIWNGTEYTETGDYTQNFTSANGCDSIVTLHLNILSGISQDGIAEISIYPNPATSTVSISCDNFYRATVIDMLGRIVMEVYDTTFDLSGLRPGEYIVKVSRITGEVEDLKLVKE